MRIHVFDELLKKEVTRKEFIIHLGLLVITISGVANLVKTLSNPNLEAPKNKKTGFGSGSYGG